MPSSVDWLAAVIVVMELLVLVCLVALCFCQVFDGVAVAIVAGVAILVAVSSLA